MNGRREENFSHRLRSWYAQQPSPPGAGTGAKARRRDQAHHRQPTDTQRQQVGGCEAHGQSTQEVVAIPPREAQGITAGPSGILAARPPDTNQTIQVEAV